MKLLVCGGRNYANAFHLRQVLDAIHAKRGITVVIEGGAKGADLLAREWAIDNSIAVRTCPADWSVGRKAGPERNARMLKDESPDGVLAFPGGSGTADMVRRAKAAGVKVMEI